MKVWVRISWTQFSGKTKERMMKEVIENEGLEEEDEDEDEDEGY